MKKITNLIIIYSISIILIMGLTAVEIQNHQQKIVELQNNNSLLTLELNFTRKRNQQISKENNRLKKQIAGLKKRVYKLEKTLKKLEEHFIPTPAELRHELFDTNVSSYKYNKTNFTCINFTFKMVEQLKNRNIYSCPVFIYYENHSPGHAIVAAETTEGVRYIEPQTDQVYKDIRSGMDYCNVTGSDCTKKIETVMSCYDFPTAPENEIFINVLYFVFPSLQIGERLHYMCVRGLNYVVHSI